MDSNRRFNNELAAFKEGKTVEHDESEFVKIPNSQKKSITKVALIFIFLVISGYFLIKIPFSKQNLSANAENIEQKLNLKQFKTEISQNFPDWEIDESLVNELYSNSISIRAILLMHNAKTDENDVLESYKLIDLFLERSAETNDSFIISFLNQYDAEKLTLLNEAGIDLEKFISINKNDLFSNYSFDELTLLASTDTQDVVKYFSKNDYTQKLTQSDWLLIAEKQVNPTFINVISEKMGDFSKMLTVEELVQLSSNQVEPETIIQALKSSNKNDIDALLNQNQ